MAHPEVDFLRNRARDLAEASTNAVHLIQGGDRSEELRNRLRKNLRESKGLQDLFDSYKKQDRVGLEDWIAESLTESITVFQLCLSVFTRISIPQESPAPTPTLSPAD